MPCRVKNALNAWNIQNLRQLIQYEESDLLKTKNFGRKSLKVLKDYLKQYGLSLGITASTYDPKLFLYEKISGLSELNWRVAGRLAERGIKYVGELVQLTEKDILEIKRNYLQKVPSFSVASTNRLLHRYGLRLSMKIDFKRPEEITPAKNIVCCF